MENQVGLLADLLSFGIYVDGNCILIVQSWDGKQSVVDMAVDEDQRHRKRSRDVWDEEYDKGKMKKVKMSRTAIMRDNIFQKVQSIKNRLGVS